MDSERLHKEAEGITAAGVLKKRNILLITAAAVLFCSLGLVIVAYEAEPLYYWGLILFAPLYFWLYREYSRYRRLKKVKELQENWGKEVQRKRDFNGISLLFEELKGAGEAADKGGLTGEEGYLDDRTWNDLNMDAVYEKIDRTFTSPGEGFLYRMLRTPLFAEKELKLREQKIEAFTRCRRLRERVQLILSDLGREKENGIIKLLWGEIPAPSIFAPLYSLLALLGLLAIGSIFWLRARGFLLLVLIFIINSLVIHFYRKKYLYQLPAAAISYLNGLIRAARKIEEAGLGETGDYGERLAAVSKAGGEVLKRSRYLLPRSITGGEQEIFYQYLNTIFLLEVRSFNSSLAELRRYQKEMRELVKLIGEIDALQAAASYRESLPEFTAPEFIRGNSLQLNRAYHPLLEHPVPNSIDIRGEGIVITGSNMAGKSTFLRTLGLNVLLAQTISTCPAAGYRGGFFQLITSISRTDNILAGKSFYFVEAERLLKLIRLAEGVRPALCIIDEMLSGTNSLERVQASEQILKYLLRRDVVVVMATHDLGLARQLEGPYKCYYFNDNVSREEGLRFDYRIKKGLAVTSNAIKLLDYLGYPREIVERAEKMVKERLEEGPERAVIYGKADRKVSE